MVSRKASSNLNKIASRLPGVVYQYLMRPDGSACFPYASEAIREIYKVSPEEVRDDASKVFSILHPDDLDGVFASIHKSAQNLTPWHHEYRVKFKDDTVRWLQGNAIPERNADGSTLWYGFISDITNNKQIEAALKSKTALLEAQLNSTSSGILVINEDGKRTLINSRIIEIFKVPQHIVDGEDDDAKLLKHVASLTKYPDKFLEKVLFLYDHPDEISSDEIELKSGIFLDRYSAPIFGVDGESYGRIWTFNDITDRKRALDKIEHLAFYDTLTDLPNRRQLLNGLNRALAASVRSGRDGAILFIDLDNFKTLNDTLGHDVGDLLLQQVAERLISCLRANDTIAHLARLGGDEFVVMLEDLSELAIEAATSAKNVGNKILKTLNQPYQLVNHEYQTSVSIGLALFSDNYQTQEDLLKHADIAMYQAKKDGRNTIRLFDPQMQTSINLRAALEADLRIALKEKQFTLYYQPQVYHNRQIIGAEVLLRWQHPKRGLVSPLDFIPLAEQTGLILPIGLWVLETACYQLKTWEANTHTQHLHLSVNVSARQFYQADFVAQVSRILRQSAINPDRLKLELTESLVLDDVTDTIFKMNALREIGVRFSMDDFGTGHSSLSYLTQLPLDQLKIDQSFIRNIGIKPTDSVIVQTIIGMGNNLGIDIIAEGVETELQRQFIQLQGCPIYQGYLFSKPVPLEVFEVILMQG
jgi:diguanylate cyclase (GGDEF)-like protein/PAS domain S-box-containing protein